MRCPVYNASVAKPPPSPEVIATIRLVLGLVWILSAAAVIGLPLVTGRIRMGGPGAEPIERDSDPQGFWSTYALSTGLFLLVSAGAAWLVGTITTP
jgi:uncharacterized membrane protein YphA (DoxX/SURF4 family)